MTKKIIYILSLGAILFTASCSEERLQLLPEIGSPLEEAINTENDMRLVLNGVYTQMSSSTGFGAAISIFGDLLSDNAFVSTANDGYFLNTSRMSYSPEISDFGMYDSFYDVIQQANMVIGDRKLKESKTVLNYKAEAKIARAMSYFYLLCFYSPDPKSGVNQEYGVPIQPEEYNPNNKLARSSVNEVYNYIINDLVSAINQLSNDYTYPENKSSLTPVAAKLLLSRVYLTRGSNGDYQKAVDYANDVINKSPISFAAITNKTSYTNYFSSSSSDNIDNKSETVFEIEQTAIFNTGGNAHPATFYANNGSHKSILFRQSFMVPLKNNTSDWRSSLVGVLGSNQDTPQGYFSKKWVRTTNEGNYATNIRLLRFSEAYLNRIEALFKMGQTPQALIFLNEFEQRRGETLSSTISIEKILDERRREFFAEGYRYFDLKRNGLPIIKDSNCDTNCNVPANNRLMVIPIPYYEININPNIKQYPGW